MRKFPVRPIKSFLTPGMEGERSTEVVNSFKPVADVIVGTVEHEVAQNFALPVAKMEGQHAFQELSSIEPPLQEVLSRTVALKSRLEQAQKERMTNSREYPSSGMLRRNHEQVREVQIE